MLVNAGRDFIAAAVGETVTKFDNANAFLGVGDSTTAEAKPQTDLQASTNKLRKAMDASFPQRTANVVTYQSTYGSSEANFHWQEMGLFNNATTGTMLNRKVSDQGTKTAGQVWTLQLINTHNAP